MPKKLLIELTDAEYDKLVRDAKENRRTPSQQASYLVAETVLVNTRQRDAQENWENDQRLAEASARFEKEHDQSVKATPAAGPSEGY